MLPLNLLESFLQSAEGAGFSEAARRLGLSPAAVSKNVARLEARLGVRLFQRSTRRLALTEAGERLLRQVRGPLAELQGAIAGAAQDAGEPAGTLKVAMAHGVGRMYILPLLKGFLERYPGVQHDWRFDNRTVDLIGEGYDVAIAGGIELAPGVVARELGRPRILLAAAPSYLAGRQRPRHPSELAGWEGIARRSAETGRLRDYLLRNAAGEEAVAEFRTVATFDDPEAMAQAVCMGLGVALLPAPHAAPLLEAGQLVRLLPEWHAEVGPLSIYYSSKQLLPAKTRAFVDYLLEQMQAMDFAGRLDRL
ncbi:LysR family transcriptional regulator [Pseudoduganella violaceinigra]|uniref:LysR family transcriptional regulator n=1 Tax=Pseudoduganella violaceinigra TaxID=246602 RepID=UPI0004216210|nr:LysR family transcriptional regulator [Pseudoduganella violaceinigra]